MKSMRLLFVCVASMTCGACFVPDTEALHDKILNECLLTPIAPACVDHTNLDDPTTRRVWTAFLEDVNSELEQNCVLDLNCADDLTRRNADLSIPDCFHLDDPVPLPWDQPEPRAEPDLTEDQISCVLDCYDDIWFSSDDPCGNLDGTCSPDLVDSCEDRDEACRSECRAN